MAEARSELFLSSWKVFLDGVELPHQGFTINYAVDAESTASISLEPDPLIASFRPSSVIHIFVRDRYAGAESDPELAYKLFWEGMLVGINGAKQTTARYTNLSAVGLFSCLEMFKAFAAGGTDLVVNPVVSGSTLPATIVDSSVGNQYSSTTPLDLDFLAGILTDNMAGESLPYRDSADPAFSDRIIKLLGYLSSHNALLRMQVTRYRLLDKICGIPDSLLQGYLKGTLGNAITRNASEVVSAEDSIMSIIRHMMSYGFYRSVLVPAPFRPTDEKLQSKPKEKHKIDFFGENREVFQIYKTPLRNDMVLTPHMFFAMPPPCNLIFPDHIVDLTFSRNFIAEPTRVCIADPLTNASGISYLAPTSLIQNAIAVTGSGNSKLNTSADELFGILLDLMTGQPSDDQKSVYIHKGEDDRRVNMLRLFTNEELEKGILTQTGTNGIESAVTLSQIFSTETPDPNAEQTPAQRATAFVNGSSNQEYRDYVTQLANYIYRLSKYSATDLSIRLSGHRWLVPGFSSVVFNKDGSYIGQIRSMSLSVTSDGLESTSITMSEVRPLASFDIATAKVLVDGAVDLVNKAEKARTEQREKAEDRFKQNISQLIKKLEELRDSVSKSKKLIDDIYQWNEKNSKYKTRATLVPLFENNKNTIISAESFSYRQFATRDRATILDLLNRLAVILRKKSTKTADNKQFLSFTDNSSETAADQFVINNPKIGLRSSSWSILAEELTRIAYELSWSSVFSSLTGVSDSKPETILDTNMASSRSVIFRAFDLGSEFDPAEMLISLGLDFGIPALNAEAVLTDAELAITKVIALVNKSSDLSDQSLREAMFEDYFSQIDDGEIQKLIQTGEDQQAEISDLAERLADLIGIPIPPSFYNKNLLDLDRLDKIYQEILGCAPFYSQNKNQTFFKLETLTENDKISALSQYIKGLEKLNSLYPFLSGVTVQGGPDQTWFDVHSKSSVGASTTRWADEKIARKGTTMKQFLQDNQLKKEVLQSSTSDGIPAFVFTPANYVQGDWDNTVYSKIVDLAQVVGDTEKEDPAVAEIRNQKTTAQYLKTSNRQGVIRTYALLHFTEKGFDGT